MSKKRTLYIVLNVIIAICLIVTPFHLNSNKASSVNTSKPDSETIMNRMVKVRDHKADVMRFFEFPCFDVYKYETGEDAYMMNNVYLYVLFELDTNRDLYISAELSGELTAQVVKCGVKDIIGIGSDTFIFSSLRNNNELCVKLTPQQYGSNISQNCVVMHYYNDYSNAVSYAQAVQENNSNYFEIPLYCDTFYGDLNGPVYSDVCSMTGTMIRGTNETTAPIKKTIDVFWDGSCKVTYKYDCDTPLKEGDRIKVNENLSCMVNFCATNYHWLYCYADEYWKLFYENNADYYTIVYGDIENMEIDYTYTDSGSFIGNTCNFFCVWLKPDEEISYDGQLGKYVTNGENKNLVNVVNEFTIGNKSYTVPIMHPDFGRTIVSVNDSPNVDMNRTITQLQKELTATQSELEAYKNGIGDVDGNGSVDVTDAQIILNYYVESVSGLTYKNFNDWISDRK